MGNEFEKPVRKISRKLGIIPWRTSMGIGANLFLDYQDTKVGSTKQVFYMATQIVIVKPFQKGEPVIRYVNKLTGIDKEIIGHDAIKAEEIHGKTKKGKKVRVV